MAGLEPAVPPSMEKIKESLRATWMSGDFGVIARTIASEAKEFVAGLPITAGDRVLDVACGTGNVTIPLAQRGAITFGVDIAPNLLEQARARAGAEGLPVTFREGDAEALPYPDASFDLVTSMFGAMFAPRPEVVASEFARVLRPGGLLAMANWNPEGFSGRMFKVSSGHVPPPPKMPAPALWGDVATVHQRLQSDFRDIQTEIVPIRFDMPMNAAGVVEHFRTYFGPTKVAFSRLDAAGQKEFSSALEALWASANQASDPDQHMLVHNEYLRVLATRA